MKIFLCIFVSVYSLAVMANDIHAVGRFENFSFDLKAKDVNELQHECMRFALAQRIAHIDDIFVSFNGHKRMHLHNRDGVWHYPKHYCGELVKVAQSIDLTPPTPNEFREIEVQFRNLQYSFTGANDAEVFNDCIEQLENDRFREADYVRLRLNQRAWTEIRNHHGWWKGAQSMCTIIDSALFYRYSKSP